jgi:hypothetical protein
VMEITRFPNETKPEFLIPGGSLCPGRTARRSGGGGPGISPPRLQPAPDRPGGGLRFH